MQDGISSGAARSYVGVDTLHCALPVVDSGIDVHHVEPLSQQFDRRQYPVAVQAIGIQAIGWIVRRHHESDVELEQLRKQPVQDHRVGDVGDMKLVETDQPIP